MLAIILPEKWRCHGPVASPVPTNMPVVKHKSFVLGPVGSVASLPHFRIFVSDNYLLIGVSNHVTYVLVWWLVTHDKRSSYSTRSHK